MTGMLALLLALALPAAQADTAERIDGGRFTVISHALDRRLARSLLAAATKADTFPGLPRPTARVTIMIAPDERRFREWIGPNAPEWGAAIAFPEQQRIVMQGRTAGSDAGDPLVVLRHELAHLALHERLGDLPPRWFDEGYASAAAGEWSREDVLATNLVLVTRGLPSLAALDSAFYGGAGRADVAYALAYRAVVEMAALDPQRGLTLFFRYWSETRSLDRAVRMAYGITLSGFEQHWRARTRRRYGGLAIFADLGVSAIVLLAVILPLWVARRRRNRRRLETLMAQDLAAERAREAEALAEMLRVESRPPET